jgi:hypothetical protein
MGIAFNQRLFTFCTIYRWPYPKNFRQKADDDEINQKKTEYYYKNSPEY